jgi:hypothetical protein
LKTLHKHKNKNKNKIEKKEKEEKKTQRLFFQIADFIFKFNGSYPTSQFMGIDN